MPKPTVGGGCAGDGPEFVVVAVPNSSRFRLRLLLEYDDVDEVNMVVVMTICEIVYETL